MIETTSLGYTRTFKKKIRYHKFSAPRCFFFFFRVEEKSSPLSMIISTGSLEKKTRSINFPQYKGFGSSRLNARTRHINKEEGVVKRKSNSAVFVMYIHTYIYTYMYTPCRAKGRPLSTGRQWPASPNLLERSRFFEVLNRKKPQLFLLFVLSGPADMLMIIVELFVNYKRLVCRLLRFALCVRSRVGIYTVSRIHSHC